MNSADLHMHTTASDGTDSIEKRIEDAEKHDLNTIALTDHDSINKELSDRSYIAENGIEVITGAEIKCKIKETGIEILAYFLDPQDEKLAQLLEKTSKFRIEKIQAMAEKLDSKLEKKIDSKNILARAEGNPGRPHVAEELIDLGIAKDQKDAFENFIREDCFGYVETEKLKAKEVIEVVKSNGGVTSLAHPGRDLERENAEEIVAHLKDLGLDAIEVPYTYNHKRKEGYGISFGQLKAMELAEENNLLVTGGSDCHGSESNKYNIGSIRLPADRLEALRARSQDRR